MKTFTLFVLAIAMLAGCATSTVTTGRDFDTTKVPQIEKGKTTDAELTAWLGAPYQKAVLGDGSEIWTWSFMTNKARAQSYVVSTNVKVDTVSKRLLATIREGVVESYSFTAAP